MDVLLTFGLVGLAIWLWVRQNRTPPQRAARVAGTPVRPRQQHRRRTTPIGLVAFYAGAVRGLAGALRTEAAQAWQAGQRAAPPAKHLTPPPVEPASIKDAPLLDLTLITTDNVNDFLMSRQQVVDWDYVAPPGAPPEKTVSTERAESGTSAEPVPNQAPEPGTKRQNKAILKALRGEKLSGNDLVALIGGTRQATLDRIAGLRAQVEAEHKASSVSPADAPQSADPAEQASAA
jgi:hypothetical protein